MDFPVHDPGFLGAIVGAVAGLLGAAFGGVATYYASLRQYRTEHETKQNSALGAVLIEICRNHSSLFRELDRVLPLWLSRLHINPTGAKDLHESTCPIPKCDTRIYDTFFSELIPSPYGPELKSHYDRLIYINWLSKHNSGGLPPDQFESYVQALALGLESAINLATTLQRHVSKVLPKGWGKDDDFGEAEYLRERALYMAALYRTKLSDLESFIVDGEIPSGFPHLIKTTNKEMLDSWVIPARLVGQTRR